MTFVRCFHRLSFVLAAGVLPLVGASRLDAQNGDREGHVMTPPPEHWDIPPAPVLSPEEAKETMRLEKGFDLELVAAEPMVHDPVALAFDGNGRLWVAEMRGYMPDIEGEREDETFGRISVLEDTDGDGRADEHTVFLEDYLLPRALALVDAGETLLFADNESLYEAEIRVDEAGNISAGEVTMVDEDYAAGGNPEHKPNGLLQALDNWIYNAKSDLRYRKINGEWVTEKTEDRGQWGIAQDDYGRLLTNTNSNLISVEELAPGLTVRNPRFRFRTGVRSRIDDQSVWPARITPGINRGYMDRMLDDEGHLVRPTAVSGMAMYRGNQFPENYRGDIFIPEPAGNLVKRAVVKEKEDGFRTIESAYRGREFLASTDERSRMVDAYDAPDGTLYLVDFYRGLIQHETYLTSYLRAQVEERGLHEPAGLGRIWRVRHEGGNPLNETPRMQEQSSVELVGHLSHPSGWWRDTAQRLIVERGGDEAMPALRETVRTAGNHLAGVHAIWSLEGLGALDPATLESALADENPRVVAEAIRAGETLADAENGEKVLSLLRSKTDADSVHVRRQLAASLGRFGERAVPALVELVTADSYDRLLGDLAVSGLSGHELAFFRALPASHDLRAPLIETLVRRDDSEELSRLVAALESPGEFRQLARHAVSMRRGREAGLLVAKLDSADTSPKVREAIARGMIDGGKDKKFKPIPTRELAALDRIGEREGVGPKRAGKIAALFDVGSGEERRYLTTEAHRRQFEKGQTHYRRVCLACHQAHGNGQQYLAPPLVGAEWVTGSPRRLIALVMDGVSGPIEVLGKTYTAPEVQPLMPGLRHNPEVNDEQIAAILTYVRNAWGNAASPVSTKAVKRYRESNPARQPWSAEELFEVE